MKSTAAHSQNITRRVANPANDGGQGTTCTSAVSVAVCCRFRAVVGTWQSLDRSRPRRPRRARSSPRAGCRKRARGVLHADHRAAVRRPPQPPSSRKAPRVGDEARQVVALPYDELAGQTAAASMMAGNTWHNVRFSKVEDFHLDGGDRPAAIDQHRHRDGAVAGGQFAAAHCQPGGPHPPQNTMQIVRSRQRRPGVGGKTLRSSTIVTTDEVEKASSALPNAVAWTGNRAALENENEVTG